MPLSSQRELEVLFGPSAQIERIDIPLGAMSFTAALVTPEEQLFVVITFHDANTRRLVLRVKPEFLLSWGNSSPSAAAPA